MIDNIKIIINTRNRRTKFINLNTIHIRNCIKTMKYIILLNLFNNIFMNNKIYVIEYKSYNITLKIKGIGIKQIFSSDSFFQSKYYPNEIYINGYNQSNVTHSYYLNQIDNIIELVWYNLIDDCQQMFQYCYDITEIDLSNFNTYKQYMKEENKENEIKEIFEKINKNINNEFDESIENIENNSNIYIPKCLMVMSLYPNFAEFEKILTEIYRYSLIQEKEYIFIKEEEDKLQKDEIQNFEIIDMNKLGEKQEKKEFNIDNNKIIVPMDKIIENLLIELPVPPRGIFKVEYTLINQERELKQNLMNQLPLVDINRYSGCSRADCDCTITSYRALFFCSCHSSWITPCAFNPSRLLVLAASGLMMPSLNGVYISDCLFFSMVLRAGDLARIEVHSLNTSLAWSRELATT